MRRYTFYLSAALLAFGIGSFVVFKFFWNADGKIQAIEVNQVADQTQTPRGFGTGSGFAIPDKQLNEAAYLPKLTCNNKEFLPVWSELKKDKEFRERAKEFYMNADCSAMLEVQEIDLNDDGRKEYILQGNNGNLCSATGSCAVWIYQRKNNGYRLLLQSYAYSDGVEKWIEVEKQKTKGYRNILLKTHSSASDTIFYFYEFNGNRYIESNCLLYSTWFNQKEPLIKTCREAWKN